MSVRGKFGSVNSAFIGGEIEIVFSISEKD
jgi:hypothetical protein